MERFFNIAGPCVAANHYMLPMEKPIRNLAIAALFIFPGISGFPQEVQQEETKNAII